MNKKENAQAWNIGLCDSDNQKQIQTPSALMHAPHGNTPPQQSCVRENDNDNGRETKETCHGNTSPHKSCVRGSDSDNRRESKENGHGNTSLHQSCVQGRDSDNGCNTSPQNNCLLEATGTTKARPNKTTMATGPRTKAVREAATATTEAKPKQTAMAVPWMT